MGEDHAPRPLHVFGARIVAGQFQGEVGLDAAAHVQLAAGIHGPTAVGQLTLDQIEGQPAGQIRVFPSEEG